MTMDVDARIPRLGAWIPELDAAQNQLQFLAASAGQTPIGVYDYSGSPLVLLNDQQLVRAVFADQKDSFHKGPVQQGTFKVLLGESVSVSEGVRHAELRSSLAPIFSRRAVAHFAPRLVEETIEAGRAWSATDTIDLFAALHRLTVRTFGQSLLADDSLWHEGSQFDQAREHVWSWMNEVATQNQTPASAISASERAVRGSITVMQQLISQALEERGTEARAADVTSSVVRGWHNARRVIDADKLRDQVIAFLLAAHETTASAVFWSLYLLAQSPSVLDRLRHEIDEVLRSRSPGAADLSELPYSNQLIREALRLYPPAGRQYRRAREDVEVGGFLLRRGTSVFISHYLLHRNTSAFPQPEVFQPLRFADASPLPYSYIPFGSGDHVCLGRQYALMEAQLILLSLVQRYDIDFVAPTMIEPVLAITLRPAGNTDVKVRPRF